MKELFLNPTAAGHKNSDHFLRAQGIEISEPLDRFPVTNVRIGRDIIFYGFKRVEDLVKTAIFLTNNGIGFECDDRSKRATYEYHIVIRK